VVPAGTGATHEVPEVWVNTRFPFSHIWYWVALAAAAQLRVVWLPFGVVAARVVLVNVGSDITADVVVPVLLPTLLVAVTEYVTVSPGSIYPAEGPQLLHSALDHV
jgi:hypothetical protein